MWTAAWLQVLKPKCDLTLIPHIYIYTVLLYIMLFYNIRRFYLILSLMVMQCVWTTVGLQDFKPNSYLLPYSDP